jgi:esterase/lipase superfamily enzyme
MNDQTHSEFIFISFCRISFINLIALILLLGLAACASKKLYEINLMPAPDIYEEGVINPFTDTDPMENIPYSGILYATDRAVAHGEDHFYLNERGQVLRLGVGEIELGIEGITWEEAKRISLLKNRTKKYPLRVTTVREFGILVDSFTVFTDPELKESSTRQTAKQYAAAINKKLATSQRKDIYIYVHGFKVVFENPLLVTAELWHFLGYDGTFIAYAWPATPSSLAYASDAETAAVSSRNLRIFLEYLARETEAERIHIIGYSAGTRVVLTALNQIALLYHDHSKTIIQEKLRIGHVILVGSDFDRRLFGAFVNEGLLKVPKTLTVYLSATDKALGISKWLFRRERLGQMWNDRTLPPVVDEYLRRTEALILIDVTDAESAAAGNGHAYFRKSPWASSDILMTLMYDLGPDERGLVYAPDLPIWTFPSDYIQRLRTALLEYNSDLRNDSKISSGSD